MFKIQKKKETRIDPFCIFPLLYATILLQLDQACQRKKKVIIAIFQKKITQHQKKKAIIKKKSYISYTRNSKRNEMQICHKTTKK